MKRAKKAGTEGILSGKDKRGPSGIILTFFGKISETVQKNKIKIEIPPLAIARSG
jgi:hypothetical protein